MSDVAERKVLGSVEFTIPISDAALLDGPFRHELAKDAGKMMEKAVREFDPRFLKRDLPRVGVSVRHDPAE